MRVIFLMLITPLIAADVQWTNGNHSEDLTTAGNWSSNSVPGPSDNCLFDSSSNGSPLPTASNNSFGVASFTFQDTTEFTFTLTNCAFALYGDGFINQSTGTQTFYFDGGSTFYDLSGAAGDSTIVIHESGVNANWGSTALLGSISYDLDNSTSNFVGAMSADLGTIQLTNASILGLSGSASGGSASFLIDSSMLQLSGDSTLGSAGLTGTNSSQILLSGSSSAGSASISLHGSSMVISGSATGGSASINLSGTSSLLINTTTNSVGAIQTSTADAISLFNTDLTLGSSTISGSIQQIGTSSIISPSDLTLSGTANLNLIHATSGNLVVTGSVTADLQIDSGATLSGTGTVTGTVTVQGSMAPGSSIGTFTINGNYVQAGGTYEEEIAPKTALVNVDQLIVNGGNFVVSQPSTFLIMPAVGQYIEGDLYPVAILDTGVAEGLDLFTIATTNPSVSGNLFFQSPYLYLQISLFAAPIHNANAQSVANALKIMSNNPANAPLFNLLFNSSDPEYALNQLHPALLKGAAVAAEYAAFSVQEALNARIVPLLQNCPSVKQYKTFWITGLGDFFHQHPLWFQGSPQYGYLNQTGGVAVGFDGNIGSFYFGGLSAYTYSSLRWDAYQGKAKINSGYLGGYGSAIGSILYANLSIIGSWNAYEEERNIYLTSGNAIAKNSHPGKSVLSHFDTGVNLTMDWFTIRPYDSLDYLFQFENQFTESGAGIYDLSVKSARTNFVRNELGLQFAMASCQDDRSSVLDLNVGWVREVRINGEHYQSGFVIDPVPFITTGTFLDRNLLSAGGELAFTKNGCSYSLYYNGLFGSNFQENRFGAQLGLAF